MRILICAHDYPPINSPQSLRVGCLARELLAAGHEVCVLTRVGAAESVAEGAALPRVVRTSAGWFERAIALSSSLMRVLRFALRSGKRHGAQGGAKGPMQQTPSTADGLNWRGRVVRRLRELVDGVVFPDSRSLWVKSAVLRGRTLCMEFDPDIILGSHEPVAGVMVARSLSESHDLPWVAELGDPILAPYTPTRWLKRAFAYEREATRLASAVVVTSESTAQLLQCRHRIPSGRIAVIPQGFGARHAEDSEHECRASFPDDVLHLVYTGRFYAFRDPGELIHAVLAVPRVVLTVAGPAIPEEIAHLFSEFPTRLRFLGMLSHDGAVALQSSADLLVNIGNEGMTQVPGKFMEYLGSSRPKIHISAGTSDPTAHFVRTSKCGFVVDNERISLTVLLDSLLQRKARNQLSHDLRVGEEYYRAFRWDSLAVQLAEVCERARRDWLQKRHGSIDV